MPVITISGLADISWRNEEPELFVGKQICIYLVAVSDFLDITGRLMNLLSSREKEHAGRFSGSRERNGFIVRRSLLKIIMAKHCGTSASEIVIEDKGGTKPFIKAFEQIDYSISHSGNYILIAISKEPIGIDIEELLPHFDRNDLLDEQFSEDEKNKVGNAANGTMEFFKYWTRKEALVKGTGKGIDDDLASIPCIDGMNHIDSRFIGSEKDWSVLSFCPADDYYASIAYSGHVDIFYFYRVNRAFMETYL